MLHANCLVSLVETICMKYQIVFSRKIRKISSVNRLLNLKPETICMKCQILYSRKNKKNIISLSSDESAHSVVHVRVSVKSISSNTEVYYDMAT